MYVQVLPGYVSSVEDHGYLISFGIEDKRAFLPKKDVIEGTVHYKDPIIYTIVKRSDV